MKTSPFIFGLILCLLSGCASPKQYVFHPVSDGLDVSGAVPTAPATTIPPATPIPPRVIPVPEVTVPVIDKSTEGSGYEVSVKAARVLNGKVVSAPADTGVVVVNFPIGSLPELNQALSVYRNGVKVGKILITGPQRDDNIAGEIIEGDIKTGDEARDR